MAWLYHEGRLHRFDHGGHPAEVIGIAVRDHHDVEASYTPLSQERQHHPLAGIKAGYSGATIDEYPSPSRRAENDGIALTHVEEMDLDIAASGVTGEDGKNGKHPAGQQPARKRPLAHNA